MKETVVICDIPDFHSNFGKLIYVISYAWRVEA